jgi:hypothetical protein
MTKTGNAEGRTNQWMPSERIGQFVSARSVPSRSTEI